jgi:hypothetical protein
MPLEQSAFVEDLPEVDQSPFEKFASSANGLRAT